MKRALLLVLLLLPWAPGATAQAADPVELLVDGTGDVQWVGSPTTATMPTRFASFDLVGLQAQERAETITFTVFVSDLDAGAELTYLESAEILVGFQHVDVQYRVMMGRWTELGSSGAWGSLYRYDASNDLWNWLAQVPVTTDEDANSYTTIVTRSNLKDGSGAAPFPGRQLDAVWAEGRHMEFNPDDIGSIAPEASGWVDRMPDEGVGDVPLPITLGLEQSGDVSLSSPRPFRISNGEATTFVYDVVVANRGSDADRFRFRAEDLPTAWEVNFPTPVVTLAAGEQQEAQVWLTVPFAHQHGAQEQFTLAAASETDDSQARIALGITYTEVPQPSGHHPRVWLHSMPYTNNIFSDVNKAIPGRDHYLLMNADQEYASATNEQVEGDRITGFDNTRSWVAWLSPSLGMGLDFDLDREGVLSLPIESTVPMTGVEARAVLWHWSTLDRESYTGTEVFDVRVSAGDWAPQESKLLEIPFQVHANADRLPPQELQGLTLLIWLYGGPDDVAMDPTIGPGAYLDLPLFEYHDELVAPGDGFGGLAMAAIGEAERFANPASTVVVPMRLTNNEASKATVSLRALGENAEWVRFSQPTLRIDALSQATFDVAVQVPADAPDGMLAELVIEAADETGHSALQRLRVVVDTDQVHADDTAQLDSWGEKEAPTPVLLGLLAVLGAVLVARRRLL